MIRTSRRRSSGSSARSKRPSISPRRARTPSRTRSWRTCTPPSEDRRGKTPGETRGELVELVLPNDANTMGNVLGGRGLHWIDLAAAIVAHRHCRSEAVTASMDELSFLAPIRVGQLAILSARMTYVARTSMEIRVDVDCEDLLTGTRQRTSTA